MISPINQELAKSLSKKPPSYVDDEELSQVYYLDIHYAIYLIGILIENIFHIK